MKFFILIFAVLLLCGCIGSNRLDRESDCSKQRFESIYLENFFVAQGVIIPKNYPHVLVGDVKRFTPNLNQIVEAEELIKEATNFIYQRNFENYTRQYFGYLNENQDSILAVNLLHEKERKKYSCWEYDYLYIIVEKVNFDQSKQRNEGTIQLAINLSDGEFLQ